jgi:hypothetical protein
MTVKMTNRLKNEKKKLFEITDSSISPRDIIPWWFESQL